MHPTEGARACNKGTGLADDIRYYGQRLRDAAYEKIGHLYPTVTDDEGQERTVIAWIWARTVTNPNPANPVQVPLVRSWWLSKKKGKEAWIEPVINGNEITYVVRHDANGPKGDDEGTVNRRGAKSIIDGTPIDFKYIRQEGKEGRIGFSLIAIVAEGNGGRLYLSPSSNQAEIAAVKEPTDAPQEDLPLKALSFRVQEYGHKQWKDLFSPRQLTALTTLADLIPRIREEVLADALAAGMPEGERLDDGGSGAQAYADAVSVYLALAVSRQTDYESSICTWNSARDLVRNVFGRQAIPMAWDFAEVNPFSSKAGNFMSQIGWVSGAVETLPAQPRGYVEQADAMTRSYAGVVVSTDPPYYDNIGYSDLSDYFYVWLRKMLEPIVPSLVRTSLTPKAQELVANPYRHDGKEGAAKFFEEGFGEVFAKVREDANTDIPMTVYYAYKQKDSKDGTSSGWYTLLEGLINAGWEVTATWPVRSERNGRLIGIGTNSLASSIVLACRPRPVDAPTTTLRAFSMLLKQELSAAITTLLASGIDPVDMNQAAIGPGISVYSRFSKVREANGEAMGVKKALELINATLDEVLGDDDVDYDADTRFAVRWYQQYGWGKEDSGIVDQLSLSCGTTLASLRRGGILDTAGGYARLLPPKELGEQWDVHHDPQISLWEALMRLAGIFEKQGGDAVIDAMAALDNRVSLDQVHMLGFRMYHEADKAGDVEGALALNNLMQSWDDLADMAMQRDASGLEDTQGELGL